MKFNAGDLVKLKQTPEGDMFIVVGWGTRDYPPTWEGPETLIATVVGQVGGAVWVKLPLPFAEPDSGDLKERRWWTFRAWIK